MIITKDARELGCKLDPRTSREARIARVSRVINESRYEVVGLNGNNIKLRARYNTARDSKGRFAKARRRK
jgi:hypothetical protein